MNKQPAVEDPIEEARRAAAAGEWEQAYELLRRADQRSPLDRASLALLADFAYASGHFDVTIAAWERAYAISARAGEALPAAEAAVRIAMHLLFDTALMAPVRAWTKRVDMHLEGFPDTPIHAWLAVVKNYERLLSGQFEEARAWARKAIELEDLAPAPAAIGRVAEARSLILEGNAREGLELLNQAALATMSGNLEPIWTGVVYCEVVCGLQGLAQYDLAEEWTEAMDRWRQGQPVGSIHGRCRVHRAEILRLRGAFAEAEEEALAACEELRPYLRREFGWPLTELGRIRFRRGDLEGAEQAFWAAHEAGWDAQPGLALVELAKGNVTGASISIRDTLARPGLVPFKEAPPNNELRRVPLLEAQVEIELAAGNLELMESASQELSLIATRFESKPLLAGAALARGRTDAARKDWAAARSEFDVAVRLWSEVGAPYETAIARIGLAEACLSLGDEARAVLENRSAQGALERMRRQLQATKEPDPLPGIRQTPDDEAQQGKNSVFRHEGDFWLIEFDGLTVRLHDLKGLGYLALLLASPGRDFHAVELATASSGHETSEPAEPTLRFEGDAGPVLDALARDNYRRRLLEIDEDIEDAQEMGNSERSEQAMAERDFLLQELARAVGLGGRERRVGTASERARVSVTRAIRKALIRIRQQHSPLSDHLERTIRTGTYCCYSPDPRVSIAWKI